jgi:methyltransferase-like protein/trans-aconitate methyltransferase
VPAAASSYDAVPYSVCAFAQTRPDRLGSVAALFGMTPALPGECRVLELGCASGGNLIPMALSWPAAQFVGIDLSQRQIDDGQRVAQELGLSNVDLRCLSILDVPSEVGMFDYILCHGVYSWVPPEVQNKILEICRDHLNPQGVAYISYNTFPGWHARAAIREMLCYHTEKFERPEDRIREARGLLTFLVRSVGSHEAAFNSLMRHEMSVLASTPDTYLLHEHLEEYNEPLYFRQFVDRAAEKDLQYLGEAAITQMVPSRLGTEIEATLRQISSDLVEMEQYMDFLRNRMFRQTLLCHDDVKLDHALRPDAVETMWIASAAKPVSQEPDLKSDAAEDFRIDDAGHTLTSRDPVMKAAMTELARRWPESIEFCELVKRATIAAGLARIDVRSEQSRLLAMRLLNCYTAGLAELSLGPPHFVASVSQNPVASPYARLRAREGAKVVNMRLEATVLSEPARLLMQHLDGQHDRAALVALVQAWMAKRSKEQAPDEKPTEAARHVDELLASFARGALLVG